MTNALIIVDVQNDFLPGGALGVTDGDAVIEPLIAVGESDLIDYVVFTQDWHAPDHIGHRRAAAYTDHRPTYQDGDWPVHCVAGHEGAEIDQLLLDAYPDAAVFRKGTDRDVEAYSGFQGRLSDDVEGLTNSLAFWLGYNVIDGVYIGGLALDYCVYATAMDAFAAGVHTTVLLDATRPVSYLGGVNAVADFARYSGNGLETATVTDLLGG